MFGVGQPGQTGGKNLNTTYKIIIQKILNALLRTKFFKNIGAIFWNLQKKKKSTVGHTDGFLLC